MSFTGDGSGLVNLDGDNITSGTVADGRLSADVTLQGIAFNGNSELVQLTGGGLLPAINGSNLQRPLNGLGYPLLDVTSRSPTRGWSAAAAP